MSSKLKSSYLFASKKAFANPGGVIARKSASVSGCAHASCGINFCADLCRYAKFGFPRPGLVYNGNLFGTFSQCLYTFGGGVNVPHKSVRFVHGSPYSHGWNVILDGPIYSRRYPTGFSIAHQIGLHCLIIRKQALTTFKPSCGFLCLGSALQFKTENSVQGGAAKTPYTFSGGVYASTS